MAVYTFGNRHRFHWNRISTNLQEGQIGLSNLSDRCIDGVLCWDGSRETTLTVLRARTHWWDSGATASHLNYIWCFLSVWRVKQAMLLLPTAFARYSLSVPCPPTLINATWAGELLVKISRLQAHLLGILTWEKSWPKSPHLQPLSYF